MEIQEKLLKFKFHALIGIIVIILIYIVATTAPRFIDLLGFFWPLLASTALFLAVGVVFSRVTPQATDAPGEKAAEGLLDYVAGQPEVFGESYKTE